MENIKKYKQIFIDSLSIPEEKVNDNLKYNEIPEWE